jgi:hypothetical protein
MSDRVPGMHRQKLRALVLVPSPDQPGLTEAERIALRLRAEATATGRCVCGAHWKPTRKIRRGAVVHVRMLHESDCPAADGPHLQRLAERLGDSILYDSILYDSIVVEFKVAA